MRTAALLFAVPTVGHVNHMIALARLLATSGFSPLLVTAPSMASYLESLGGICPSQTHPAFELSFAPTPGRKSHFRQVFEPQSVLAQAEVVRALIARLAPAFVVSKDYVAPHLIAPALGVPCAAFLSDGVAPLCAAGPAQRALDDAERAAFLSAAESLGAGAAARRQLLSVSSASLNLVRGFPDIGVRLDAAPAGIADTLFLGALVFDGADTLVAHWRAELSAMPRPLIYASLGTVGYSAEAYRHLAAELAPFEASVLMTSLNVDAAEIGPLPPNVRLERYVPNAAALEVADLFVSNGGHGGLLSALCAGTPTVVWPQNALTSAQVVHGETVEELGVGFRAEAGREPGAITAAAQAALHPRVAQTAQDLAVRLRQRSRELSTATAARLSELFMPAAADEPEISHA